MHKLKQIKFSIGTYLATIGANNQVIGDSPIGLVAQFRLFRESIERDPFPVNISHFNMFYKDSASLHQARGVRPKLHPTVAIIPVPETHRNCQKTKWNALFEMQGSVEEKLALNMKNLCIHAAYPKGQRSEEARPSLLPPLRAGGRSRMSPHRTVHGSRRRMGMTERESESYREWWLLEQVSIILLEERNWDWGEED